MTSLTEVIRDNSKNARLKQAAVPALGELLFLVATHEEQKGRPLDSWTVPAIAYTMVSRCIRDGVSSHPPLNNFHFKKSFAFHAKLELK